MNMVVQAEALIKEKRVWAALDRLGFDSLILTRRENFAWLTCGGRAVGSYGEPISPVWLVLTPTGKYAVGYSIDVIRTAAEELAGLDYQPITLPSFGKTPAQVALELAKGKVAADTALADTTPIAAEITKLYEPFTPEEMERYTRVGAEVADIQHELAYWVRPGMTEREVAAHAWELFVARGFEMRYLFVGADERVTLYRHPVFGDKRITQLVQLAPCGVKYGLHVPITRFVYFSEPPEDIRRRFRAVATMQAALLTTIRPGVKLAALRALVLQLFDELGYPEEKFVHFHGGPINYAGGQPDRALDADAIVTPNMAFAWYLTVAGAKHEELMLVNAEGARLATVDPHWPLLQVEYQGRTVSVPDILVRSTW
jgi:Xaa-Pro aminopeptidase